MMAHDIIDNRDLKLIDELAARFPSSDKAKFAVGYFFLSGLEPLADKLYNLSELRLLIGNTTNKETIEQISEGYRRLEPVQDTIEALRYPKRSDIKARMDATVANMRESVELMDQTDASQQLVSTLVQLIAEKRLQVRVYNRGRLHAKAYIFDYTQMYDASGRALPRTEPGVAIIGSSNFTLSGISHNTELNVVVHGKDNHERLTQWFEELWAESDDFDAALMAELQQSWAVAPTTPYDIYMKTLYMLVRDRLEEAQQETFLWNDDITARLADFQRVAVRQAIQTITRYNGCFVADVVGLGKSYIGAAIVKHFERVERARPLIICPKPLLSMWERYNEIYQLNAHVLSMSMLRNDEDGINRLLSDVKYKDRDFVLVDESHNFRNPDAQRYQILQQYLEGGRRCVLLTATPRTRDAWDIY
ncbi:MAG: phospholipase D-like domain-containing protein, partial [Chloroflexota bacterium]|nr:phospholipase D-like domain-containing protein [Chloroflexota bacterium]